MTHSSAIRVVRASAIYDLLLTAPFALVWTAAPTFDVLARLQGSLSLSGTLPDASSAFTMLFANLMGSLVTVWSILRLVRPSLALGAADTAARALFSLGFLMALGAGATTLLVGFLMLEIAWFVVQGGAVAAALHRARRTLPARTLTA